MTGLYPVGCYPLFFIPFPDHALKDAAGRPALGTDLNPEQAPTGTWTG